MMKWEIRFRQWIMYRILWFGYIAVFLLGLFLRCSYLPMLAADMEFLYSSWFDAIKNGGMAGALVPSLQYDYSPLHLYLWTLCASLLRGLDTLTALKLICITIETFLCAASFLLIRALLPPERKRVGSFAGFTLLWLSPILLWNAAGWGQTDTFYALFSILSVLLLIKEKPVCALACLGAALAWKLQTIFLLPLFLTAYFCAKKRFSLLWFLLVPALWLLSGVPMALIGESPLYAFQAYFGQVDQYASLTCNAPNLFALMGDAVQGLKRNVEGMFLRTGIALCTAALGGMAVWLISRRIWLTERLTVLLGAWCVLCCVFFLPRMHERYGLVGEVLLLCWAVSEWKPRAFAYVLLGALATLSAYAEYLFREPFFPLQLGGAMNLVLLGLLTWELVRLSKLNQSKTIEEAAV